MTNNTELIHSLRHGYPSALRLGAADALEAAGAYVARLQREVANRNQRALDGDKSLAAFDSVYAELEALKNQKPIAWSYNAVNGNGHPSEVTSVTFNNNDWGSIKPANVKPLFAAAGASPATEGKMREALEIVEGCSGSMPTSQPWSKHPNPVHHVNAFPTEHLRDVVEHARVLHARVEAWVTDAQSGVFVTCPVSLSTGASPVEPSQAQPSDTARDYMTGYSDGKEWAGDKNQAQPESSLLIGEMRESGVVWFNQNPHAWPLGTTYYAVAAPQPKEPK